MSVAWPGTPDFYDDEPDPYVQAPHLEVWVTDNPVVAELLGPDGEVITQWRERPPIGFDYPGRN